MLAVVMALLRGLKWIGGFLTGMSIGGVVLSSASLLALFTVGQDLFVWSLDQLLGLVVAALSGVDLGDMPSIQDHVDDLAGMGGNRLTVRDMTVEFAIGSTLMWVWGKVGMTQALGIIASAVAVKLVLRLIPFVRL